MRAGRPVPLSAEVFVSRLSRSITFVLLIAALAFPMAAFEGAEQPRASASEGEASDAEMTEATTAETTSAQATATPTTTPSSTPSASPSPTPESSPSSTPSPGPSTASPAPVETTPPPAVPDLVVRSQSAGLLAQLGATVEYVVVVTNRGAEAVRNVTVTNDVPAELDVAGVPVVDVADTINLITVGSNEQVVWGINTLGAGRSVRLPWTGQVVDLGDFSATNSVIATAPRSVVTATSDVYLAASGSPRVDDGIPAKVKGRTVTRRTVTYEQRRVATAPDAQAAPGSLPATGVDPLGWVLLGVVALITGIALMILLRPGGDRRRALVALVAALLTLAACVSGEPGTTDPVGDAGTETEREAGVAAETDVADDEVLGTRVDRGNGTTGPGTGNGGSTPDDGADANDADDDSPVVTGSDDGADGTFVVETVPVETIEVVRLAPEPATIVPLGALTGANTVNFEWDEPTRTMGSGTSGIIFGNEAASLTTSLSSERGPIGMASTIRNDSETDRLAVEGRVVLQISGSSGSARLTSSAIDVVLEPGGEVTAPFSFLLPSGSYSATAVFQPS